MSSNRQELLGLNARRTQIGKLSLATKVMARSERVAPVNFARESNDLRVQQRAMLDETLDALLDVLLYVLLKRVGHSSDRALDPVLILAVRTLAG